MRKFIYVLLLVVVLVALTQLSEGHRRWRKRFRDRGSTTRRPARTSSHPEEPNGRSSARRRQDALWERIGITPRNLWERMSRRPILPWNVWRSYDDKHEEPWWYGPNICVSESEELENNSTDYPDLIRPFFSISRTCNELEKAYKCKETSEKSDGKHIFTEIRECCHGFSRKEGDFGCPERLKMRNLLEEAENLGLTDFIRAVNMLRLEQQLQEGNFTVFAPVNGAFGLDSNLIESDNNFLIQDEPQVIMLSKPGAEKAIESLQDALLGHLLIGSVRTSSMEDEEVLETASPLGSTVRINRFNIPKKLITANCVPMVSTDHMASNGIIHTLSKAMKPVTKSLLDIVRSNPELSTLKTVLAAANYVSKLDDDGQITLLAPTNQAFAKMDSRLRERLLRGDRKCLEKVLQNHMIPYVMCTAVLRGSLQTRNFLKSRLNVTSTEEGKIFVNDGQVVQEDIMATNGVLHIIDSVLVPQEALGVLGVLKREGFTQLLDLLDKAQLTKTIDTAENITLFAPTNQAIEDLSQTVKARLVSNPKMLEELLKFHVSPEVKECQSFHDNELLPSLEGKNIRLNHFHTFVPGFHPHSNVKTAQCVPMTHRHIEACNGRITVLDGVMTPPKGNVIDVLASDKRFSTLVSLVKQSGLADSLQESERVTIFAPNNEAFESISKSTLDELAQDVDKLKSLLKKHVFGNALCCAGIFKSSWIGQPQVRTLAGDLLALDRDRDGTARVGRSRVVKCDLTATNGNVLEIDTVLLDEPPRRSFFDSSERHWWDWFHEH